METSKRSAISITVICRLLTLVDAIAAQLGIKGCDDPELVELEKDVKPEAVLDQIENQQDKWQSNGSEAPASEKSTA
jgi:hypothetical protein